MCLCVYVLVLVDVSNVFRQTTRWSSDYVGVVLLHVVWLSAPIINTHAPGDLQFILFMLLVFVGLFNLRFLGLSFQEIDETLQSAFSSVFNLLVVSLPV